MQASELGLVVADLGRVEGVCGVAGHRCAAWIVAATEISICAS
jgi:hypothetical protein